MKRKLMAEMAVAVPNPAHNFFGMLELQGKLRAIVTQNIDSLHERGGVPQAKINELHGHMRRLVCSDHRTPLNPVPVRNGDCDYHCAPCDIGAGPGVPPCPRCGLPLRTETVMFQQPLPDGAMEQARAAVAGADLLIVIGSTLLVQPANELPAEAFRRGIPVVMVNLDETQYDANVTCLIRESAGEFLGKVACLLAEEPAPLEDLTAEVPAITAMPTMVGAPLAVSPTLAMAPPGTEDSDDEQLFGDDDIGVGEEPEAWGACLQNEAG